MKHYKLTIPGLLPGLNEYVDAERGAKGKYKAAAMKKQAENVIGYMIKTQLRGVRFTRPVVIHYHHAYCGHRGVRPAFFVESGIALSVEPDQVELSTSALLAEFTLKRLVEEVLRRIAEGQEDGDDNEEDDF